MFSLSSLLLPLLGGFLALQAVPRSKFYLRKQGGYQVFLWSAAVGSCLLVASRTVLLIWGQNDAWAYPMARAAFRIVAPFPFFGTLALSFLLGLLAWGAFQLADRLGWDWAGNLMRNGLSRASRQDELLELQLRAIDARAPIQVTLKSRKVYVGWVVSTEGLRPDMGFLKFVPTFSGYRTRDDLSFLLTESYEKAGQILRRFEEGCPKEQDENDLVRMERFVRTEEIVSACFFDDQEYERHEERYLEALAKENENAPSRPSAVRALLDWVLDSLSKR